MDTFDNADNQINLWTIGSGMLCTRVGLRYFQKGDFLSGNFQNVQFPNGNFP